MAIKVKITDFVFEFAGHGHYGVTYCYPISGKRITATIDDMTIIDSTKNEDYPKSKDLQQLKRTVKRLA